MKKNFLFSALVVLLAGFGFGGISLATDVAQIGTTTYESLRAAIEAAQDNDVIEMLADDHVSFIESYSTDAGFEVQINKALTIDGGGYTIYGVKDNSIDEGQENWYRNTKDHDLFIASSAGDVTIKNIKFSEFGNEAVLNINAYPIRVGGSYNGTLTIENVTIDKFNRTAINIGSAKKVIISGCNIIGDPHDDREGNYFQGGIELVGAATTHDNKMEIINTTISGIGAKNIEPNSNDSAAIQLDRSGEITIKNGNFGIGDVFSGQHSVIVQTGKVIIEDGTFQGDIYASDDAVLEISGGTFSEPFYKSFIKDNNGSKCAVKNSGNKYEIGTCPISSIVDDKLYNNPGVSPDVTISQSEYNVTVGGRVNYYNKAANNGNGYRYGLEIIPNEAITDEMIADYATFSLSGAHWAAGAISGVSYSGEVSTNHTDFHNYQRSLYVYPKLSGDKLEITLNWGPYYGTETFVVYHSGVTLKPGITVTFDTDGGDVIDNLVFSGTDLQGGINDNIKVGDIVANKTGYNFTNWYLSGEDATTVYNTGSVIETDIALKANYTIKQYTITFLDSTGATISSQDYDYGANISTLVPTTNPEKASTDATGYTFLAWSGNVDGCAVNTTVSKACTFSPTYTETTNKYEIQFVDENGTTLLWSGDFAYGTTPVYSGSTPTKAADSSYTYSFNTWDPTLAPVTGAFTYKATYTSTPKSSSSSSSSSSSGRSGTTTTKTDTTTVKTDETNKTSENTTTDTENKDNESSNDSGEFDESTLPPVANYNPSLPADQQVLADGLTPELHRAYDFAHQYGITTKGSAKEAEMDAPLNRIAMAKMLVNYAVNVLGKKPDTSREVPAFADVDGELNSEYGNAVTLAYQLGIMGIGVDNFRPFDEVPRAEFGTALSRMLFGLPDGDGAYYETHLKRLQEKKIISVGDPNLQELRGYVMIMLMRSASK